MFFGQILSTNKISTLKIVLFIILYSHLENQLKKNLEGKLNLDLQKKVVKTNFIKLV